MGKTNQARAGINKYMEGNGNVKCFKCSCQVLSLVLTAVCFLVNKYFSMEEVSHVHLNQK